MRERRQPVTLHHRREPRLDEVALRVVERDRAVVVDELAHEVEVLHGDAHRPTPMRRTSVAAISSSDAISSASPAPLTATGIEVITAVASLWATTEPPAWLIARAPRRPSRPMPVSTTPSVPAPHVATAER